MFNFHYLSNENCIAQPLHINEQNHLEKIKKEIDKENFVHAIDICEKSLAESKKISKIYAVNLHILLITALNYNEQYENALLESEKLYEENNKILVNDLVLLKNFYYQRAYSYNGLHNQKYEIEYTLKALTVMQANPLLFNNADFINIYNDLYYYQNNYDDIEGMSNTFLQYVKFYNENFDRIASETSPYARRVLRKMQHMPDGMRYQHTCMMGIYLLTIILWRTLFAPLRSAGKITSSQEAMKQHNVQR